MVDRSLDFLRALSRGMTKRLIHRKGWHLKNGSWCPEPASKSSRRGALYFTAIRSCVKMKESANPSPEIPGRNEKWWEVTGGAEGRCLALARNVAFAHIQSLTPITTVGNDLCRKRSAAQHPKRSIMCNWVCREMVSVISSSVESSSYGKCLGSSACKDAPILANTLLNPLWESLSAGRLKPLGMSAASGQEREESILSRGNSRRSTRTSD